MTRHADLLARYTHLRRIGRELNNRLVGALSRSAIGEAGKKLGVLRGNALALDTEDELAVLMDFALHDVRRHRATAVERYLAERPPDTDADELPLLRAKRQARYSLFVVESADPGLGVHVRDLVRDESQFLVDVGLSQTAAVGMVLAARVMAPEGIGMTTGTALPVGVMTVAERNRFLRRLKARLPGVDLTSPSPEEASDWAAEVIRTCLRQGAAERIRYVDLAPEDRAGAAPTGLSPARRRRRRPGGS
jgi:hypothetical protein